MILWVSNLGWTQLDGSSVGFTWGQSYGCDKSDAKIMKAQRSIRLFPKNFIRSVQKWLSRKKEIGPFYSSQCEIRSSQCEICVSQCEMDIAPLLLSQPIMLSSRAISAFPFPICQQNASKPPVHHARLFPMLLYRR